MSSPPDAELLIASGCAHCPAVLASLSELLKQGLIGRLNVTNLAVHPEVGSERGVRSVPWLQLGPFALEGSRTTAELRDWAQKAASREGMRDYLAELLENQKLPDALALIQADDSLLPLLTELLGNLETPMGVRIGVGALVEEIAGSPQFALLIPKLSELLTAQAPQVRADAAYYLGLGNDPRIPALLKPLLNDSDHEVRGIVAEALETDT